MEVKWIKIVTDIFDSWKIKQLKAFPESGHTLVCIWFELLCLAGSCNENGLIVLSNRFVATEDIIANIFNEDIKMVRLALSMFEEFGMIEITDDNAIEIRNWEEYQSGDKLNEIKEKNRERQQRFRDKQKVLIEEKKRNVTNNVTNNVTSSLSISNSNNSYSLYIKDIIDYFNSTIGTNYTYKNKTNNSHITARLDEGFTVDDFKTVIDKKAHQWKNNPKMAGYLRPSTLFAKGHFEEYLNEVDAVETGSSQDTYDSVADWLKNRG